MEVEDLGGFGEEVGEDVVYVDVVDFVGVVSVDFVVVCGCFGVDWESVSVDVEKYWSKKFILGWDDGGIFLCCGKSKFDVCFFF